MNFNKFVNDKEIINAAKSFATEKHLGQTRKFNGDAYINHPAAVAKLVKNFGGNADMIAAAWLHDTLEDTNTSIEELKEKFGDKITSLVQELTSPHGLDKSTKAEYLAKKMSVMSSDALTIKLADRLNNVSDFKTAPQDFVRRYGPETTFMLNYLEDSGRPFISQQEKLIAEIRKAIEPYANN